MRCLAMALRSVDKLWQTELNAGQCLAKDMQRPYFGIRDSFVK